MIVNKKELATSPLRRDALSIISAGLDAVVIDIITKERVVRKKDILYLKDLSGKKQLSLKQFERVVVIGFGKGSHAAVSVITNTLGSYCDQAVALDIKNYCKPTRLSKKVKLYYGTHPTPSAQNLKATKAIIDLATSLGENDLALFFVGGGGSSLLCGSAEEIKGGTQVFERLTKKGASIQELNVVRKHLSVVKGGGLAKFAFPATMVSLIVSDVCGNDFGTIASGPTVYNETTIKDALKVLQRYKIPSQHLNFIETPKDKKIFKKAQYFLLACSEDAALGMVHKARSLGYKAKIESLTIEKEARDVFPPLIKKIKKGNALIAAGESTITIRGKGKGGRNQESVLGAVARAYNVGLSLAGTLVASVASDGRDYTPVAGALADTETIKRMLEKNIDPSPYLSRNDAYTFFKKIGDHIHIQKKHFNVADLMLVLKERI